MSGKSVKVADMSVVPNTMLAHGSPIVSRNTPWKMPKAEP